jgi:enoyl-CoA hydratase/carnithine racemase
MSASPYAPDDLVAGVLTIRLNVNAMNKLMALLSFVQADENVNVIVLRDECEQFGASLGAAADTDAEVNHQLVQRLRDLPQPIVAMVPGQIHDQALAALQACDIVLATGQDDWAYVKFSRVRVRRADL